MQNVFEVDSTVAVNAVILDQEEDNLCSVVLNYISAMERSQL